MAPPTPATEGQALERTAGPPSPALQQVQPPHAELWDAHFQASCPTALRAVKGGGRAFVKPGACCNLRGPLCAGGRRPQSPSVGRGSLEFHLTLPKWIHFNSAKLTHWPTIHEGTKIQTQGSLLTLWVSLGNRVINHLCTLGH